MFVVFTWQRVPGAADYHLRLWHDSPAGPYEADLFTVNDTWERVVSWAGDTAYWSVAARDAQGVEGPASSASFTTARIATTLLAPPDGAVFDYPASWPTLTYRTVRDQSDYLFAQQGGTGPLTQLAPTRLTPGTWRWGFRSANPPIHPWTSPDSEIRSLTINWSEGQPTPSTPANGATVAAGSVVRLAWAEAPGAGAYEWEVRADDGTKLAGNRTRGAWADLASRLDPGTYTWRVRSMLAGTGVPSMEVWSAWSSARSFTATIGIAPSPTAPGDGANLSSWPELRWSDVADAGGYEVQLGVTADPNSAFAPGVVTNAFSFHAPGSGFGFGEGDSAGGTRYWRVRATGRHGEPITSWSGWRSFDVSPTGGTLASPVAADMTGPVDCTATCTILNGFPHLTWTPVAKATSYRVFVRWDGSADVANAWYDVASPALVLTTYFAPPPGEATAWAVVACGATCTTTMPNTRRHFALGLQDTPTLDGPADGTTFEGPSVRLSWSRSTAPVSAGALRGRTSFQVQYHETPGHYEAVDNWFEYPDEPVVTIPYAQAGMRMDWRVREILQVGDAQVVGAWTGWRSVTRSETTPVLTSPSPGATVSGTFTVDWDDPSFTYQGYVVQLSRLEALTWWGAEFAEFSATTPGSSATFSDLPPGEYRWRVKRSDAGTYEPLSAGESAWAGSTFTVGGDVKPQPTAPVGGASAQADDVVLSWVPYLPNAWYGVMIGTTPDVTWETALYTGSAWGTTHSVTDLLPTGTLYWRVCTSMQCSDPVGFTPGFSNVQTMTITAAPGPDVTAPISSVAAPRARAGTLSTTGRIPATLRWDLSDAGSSGIASQQVQLRNGTGTWTALSVSATARSANVTLAPGATYTVRVRAVDGAGNTGSWASRTITTSLRQETSVLWTWTSGWTRVASSSASGGATRYTRAAGAKATLTFTGSAVSIVAPRSSARGNATVYVDGLKVTTIKLNADPTGARRVVFTRSWTTSGPHTVTIRVSGTSGRPRVDIDAAAILK